VRGEIAAGAISPLEDVFPADASQP
jgi:hypothetical protein